MDAPITGCRYVCASFMRAIKGCIRALPEWVRYPLTLVLFWPTVFYIRFLTHPRVLIRDHYTRISPAIVLSSLPTAPMVRELHERERLRGVVNCCREWDALARSGGLYERLSPPVTSCWVPTVDFEAPTLAHTLRAVAFIREHAERGDSVLVHCKAGRGRSVCIVLAYLVLHEGLSPRQADALVRARRPIVSKKWHLPLLQSVAALAAEQRSGGDSGGKLRVGSGNSPSSAASGSSSDTSIGGGAARKMIPARASAKVAPSADPDVAAPGSPGVTLRETRA